MGEICSGTGDWVTAQAKADSGQANWVALELRLNRVHQTLCKGIFQGGLENLCVVGGDARLVLSKFVQPETMAYIFVNHPEPPQQRTADASSSQSTHLLDRKFFDLMSKCLKPGGRLTICTDNAWYAELPGDIVTEYASTFETTTPNEDAEF